MRNDRRFECRDCGQLWLETSCTEGARHGFDITCPYCGGDRKARVFADGRKCPCGSLRNETECEFCQGHRLSSE